MFGKILIPTAIQVGVATLTVKVVGLIWDAGKQAFQRPTNEKPAGENNNSD